MIVLGIDTSGGEAGVALRAGDRLWSADLGARRGHAERLTPAVLDLLGRAGLEPREIDRIAVAEGPGSFTGVRVGLAFAQGWARAGGCSLVGAGSLDILAAACYDANYPRIEGYIVSAADVRRGEAAVAIYRITGQGPRLERELGLVAVTASPEPLPGPVMLAGDAAALLWTDLDVPRWTGSGEERARAVARIGAERKGPYGGPGPLPRYAREADAKPRRRT